MYIVQGIITKYKIDKNEITCYNILDTEDGVAEDVNIELIDKNDLVFGDCLYISNNSDYGRLFYGRGYGIVGVKDFDSKSHLFKCETKETWDILKIIDGVVIDNAFSLHSDSDTSIILRKHGDKGYTKIHIKMEVSNVVYLFVYVDNYLCYKAMYNLNFFNGRERLGVCEIEQFKYHTNIVYRIHIALISGRANVMYDDFYFDLNVRDETIYFKGENPPIYLNTVNNLKRRIGGLL